MKPTLMLLTFLVASSAFGQDAIEYYKSINDGKRFAIRGDFNSAITSYQLAFESSDFAFARDCLNAVEFSVIARDTISLDYFLKKAILQGVRIQDIEKSGRLDSYLNTHFYKDIKNQEDSLQRIYSSRINWEIRAEVNEMFSADQEMRERYYKAHLLKRRRIGREWEMLNARQVERLMQITREYGFPGERLIGLDRSEMHLKIETHNYSTGMPIVILIHHFSQPNPSYDELLFDEVRKGNLYNEHFATICDFEAEFGTSKYACFGYYGLRHQPKKVDSGNLDLKRYEAGLLKLKEIEQLNQVKGLSKYWNRLY